MKKITGWLYSWCAKQYGQQHREGYAASNMLYRIRHEAVVSAPRPGSRALISDLHTDSDALMEAGLARLPKRQRECVKLAHTPARFDDGREVTRRDLAGALGISKSSFDTHVQRGKRALATAINDLREKHGLERLDL